MTPKTKKLLFSYLLMILLIFSGGIFSCIAEDYANSPINDVNFDWSNIDQVNGLSIDELYQNRFMIQDFNVLNSENFVMLLQTYPDMVEDNIFLENFNQRIMGTKNENSIDPIDALELLNQNPSILNKWVGLYDLKVINDNVKLSEINPPEIFTAGQKGVSFNPAINSLPKGTTILEDGSLKFPDNSIIGNAKLSNYVDPTSSENYLEITPTSQTSEFKLPATSNTNNLKYVLNQPETSERIILNFVDLQGNNKLINFKTAGNYELKLTEADIQILPFQLDDSLMDYSFEVILDGDKKDSIVGIFKKDALKINKISDSYVLPPLITLDHYEKKTLLYTVSNGIGDVFDESHLNFVPITFKRDNDCFDSQLCLDESGKLSSEIITRSRFKFIDHANIVTEIDAKNMLSKNNLKDDLESDYSESFTYFNTKKKGALIFETGNSQIIENQLKGLGYVNKLGIEVSYEYDESNNFKISKEGSLSFNNQEKGKVYDRQAKFLDFIKSKSSKDCTGFCLNYYGYLNGFETSSGELNFHELNFVNAFTNEKNIQYFNKLGVAPELIMSLILREGYNLEIDLENTFNPIPAFKHLGADRFGEEIELMKKQGIIDANDFIEGKDYQVQWIENNELGHRVKSAIFVDLDTATRAVAAYYKFYQEKAIEGQSREIYATENVVNIWEELPEAEQKNFINQHWTDRDEDVRIKYSPTENSWNKLPLDIQKSFKTEQWDLLDDSKKSVYLKDGINQWSKYTEEQKDAVTLAYWNNAIPEEFMQRNGGVNYYKSATEEKCSGTSNTACYASNIIYFEDSIKGASSLTDKSKDQFASLSSSKEMENMN